ncbi:replication restart DNA helicase PriA [Halanaerobium saccharolyticum]|uniref:Probable replication restart protein PriA n=1 Tax=Halanaerobium saccharolyticum TaxID=43595 RepID=A0A4R7YXV0_9FIRM|nr:primosomal protein N' [Halanaerobium saccharolyticum]RAK07368.1 replication restart DNA helicase PriA [Halanaerobium saccharolyticum]TDW02333.1 replication restart DNA helicase PriA [Halanaerobium saccharolyticum]TDX59053.1 replication restart DNA helicase PriA [Halanaerobium saccharolyticum]
MKDIVKVVVDLPLKTINREFDYLLPEKLKSELEVGQIVRVPFGRRKLSAFVTGFKAKTDIKKSKLKEIESLLYKQSFFGDELLKLFYWTAAYYHAYLAQVIKKALPPGITEQKIRKKEVEFLKLNSEITDYKNELDKLKIRAPKQYLILKYLLENSEQKHKLKKVVESAETSRQTVFRLIDKDLITLYTDVEERIPEMNIYLKEADEYNFPLQQQEKELIDQLTDNDSENNSYLLTTENGQRRYNFIIKLLVKLLAEKKNIILLIPEIEKDQIFLAQLNNQFGDNIAFIHSQLSRGERFDQWQQIKNGKVKIAVGARSAIFAPFSELNAVIIMEENNESYKAQEHPLYHARQIAVKRLKKNNSLLLLESPFPSLESQYHALAGEYQQMKLNPKKSKILTKIIDMKKEVEKGNLGDLSQDLITEIKNQLKKNNKIILFLNRRGSANYLICRKCGHVLKCDNCDISLNYHREQHQLRCHYCGLKKEVPDNCPECGSRFISQAGVGTEKIIEQLKTLYQDLKIVRVDSDLKERVVKQRLKNFKKGEIDILVGTSILIKNQFYDQLKFLAVISADTALNSSDFRAAENNYSLLMELKSLLLNKSDSKFWLQSYDPDHYSIQAALAPDKYSFYQKEIKIRKQRNYPPFCRLLNIIISAEAEEKAAAQSKKLSTFLDNYKDKYLEKLGASPAVLSKIRNKYRWQLILKFNSMRNREYIIQLIEKKFIEKNDSDSVEIRIDVDPYQML